MGRKKGRNIEKTEAEKYSRVDCGRKQKRGKDQRWYKKLHVRNREIKEESTYVQVIGVESEAK